MKKEEILRKSREAGEDERRAQIVLIHYKKIGMMPALLGSIFYLAFLIRALLTGEDYTLVCYAFVTPVFLGESWYYYYIHREFRRTYQLMFFVFFGLVGVIGLCILLLELFGR